MGMYACLSEGNRRTQTDEPGIIMVSVMFSSHSVVICLPSNSASSPQTPALFHLAITETWQPGALETHPLWVTAKMTLGAVWHNHSRTLISLSTATLLKIYTHTHLMTEYYLSPSVSPIPHFLLADKCVSVYLGYLSCNGEHLWANVAATAVCVFICLENNLATLHIIKFNEDWGRKLQSEDKSIIKITRKNCVLVLCFLCVRKWTDSQIILHFCGLLTALTRSLSCHLHYTIFFYQNLWTWQQHFGSSKMLYCNNGF